jgi:putative tryptophan/tyrosine transport system substrate-binding protein
MSGMGRREFVALLGGAAASPLTARAQQPERIRRIGVLLNMAEDDPERQLRLAALRQGLVALGWIENRNIRIDYRFGGGDDPVRVRALAAELATSAPELIVAHTSPVVTALKAATHAIPIIFAVVNDPVGQGLIASVARPGGNITGFTYIDFEMMGKWLELLKEIAPSVTRAALIFNPATAYMQAWARELATMPKRPASEIVAEPVRDQAELEAAVAAIARDPGGGLIIVSDVFNTTHRRSIISLADRHRLPAVYFSRYFATEGGLLSYGPDITDIFRRTATYIDRILNGANPADLPAQAPTKFELLVNLNTAKALGLEVPPTLLARADEVIE